MKWFNNLKEGRQVTIVYIAVMLGLIFISGVLDKLGEQANNIFLITLFSIIIIFLVATRKRNRNY